MIQKFDGDFPVSHLKFRINNNLPSNVYGNTLKPENYVVTIQINENSINNISNLGTALVLSHEVIHAEIFRKMLSVVKRGDLDYKGMSKQELINYVNSLKNNFHGIYDFYIKRYKKGWQHEQMANYYISKMADILQKFDQNKLSRQIYEDISWIGLRGSTDLYNTLSDKEKRRINRNIKQYFDNKNYD